MEMRSNPVSLFIPQFKFEEMEGTALTFSTSPILFKWDEMRLLDSMPGSVDMNLSKLQDIVEDRED